MDEERAVDRFVKCIRFSRLGVLTKGMQVRDEHRTDYDPGRGGWGAQAQRLEIERRREVEETLLSIRRGYLTAVAELNNVKLDTGAVTKRDCAKSLLNWVSS